MDSDQTLDRSAQCPDAVSRRRFLAIGLGATAGAALAACTPAAPATPAGTTPATGGAPTPKPAPKLATSLIYGAQTINDTLDPHGTLSNSGYMAITQVYDALLTFDARGERVVGALAASYQMLNPTTMELKLRDDVKFANGEDFTAETVRWNFERLERSTDPLHAARKLTWAGTQVEVVNSTTVRLRTPTPNAILPNVLTGFFMASPRFVTENEGQVRDKALGTGSFTVSNFRTQSFIEYVRNDRSWRGTHPIETARVVAIPEAAALVSALQTGEIDIAFNPPPDQFTSLRQSFNTSSIPAGSCTVGVIAPVFPATESRLVRQALNYAVNKEDLLNAVFGGLGKVATGQLGQPGMLGYDPQLQAYPYDPPRARSLVQQAGLTGAEVNINCVVATRTLAEALAGYWNAIGLRSSVNIQEFPAFVISLTQRSDQPILTSRTDYFTTRDLDSAFFQFSNRPNVQARFPNEEFNRLFPQQRQETDPARREPILRRMAQLMHEEAACVFGVWQDFPYAFSRRIESLPISWDTSVPLWQVRKTA